MAKWSEFTEWLSIAAVIAAVVYQAGKRFDLATLMLAYAILLRQPEADRG